MSITSTQELTEIDAVCPQCFGGVRYGAEMVRWYDCPQLQRQQGTAQGGMAAAGRRRQAGGEAAAGGRRDVAAAVPVLKF